MTPGYFVGRVAVVRFGDFWVFLEPLEYRRPLLNGGELVLRIPAEYTTDFASTPRALWWRYDPEDARWCAAAGVHDLCYARQLGKLFSDCLLYDAMGIPQPTGVDPAPVRVRAAFLAGVLACGGRAYRTAPAREVERLMAWRAWSAAALAG